MAEIPPRIACLLFPIPLDMDPHLGSIERELRVVGSTPDCDTGGSRVRGLGCADAEVATLNKDVIALRSEMQGVTIQSSRDSALDCPKIYCPTDYRCA